MLGFRFKSDGEVAFYAHFRNGTVLLINSRHPDWSVGVPKEEFRVPLPPQTYNTKWQVVFLHLSSVEQMAKAKFDVVTRFSVRANLTLSHIWCVEKLSDLPVAFLEGAVILEPPI
jgi:hypothetical protein